MSADTRPRPNTPSSEPPPLNDNPPPSTPADSPPTGGGPPPTTHTSHTVNMGIGMNPLAMGGMMGMGMVPNMFAMMQQPTQTPSTQTGDQIQPASTSNPMTINPLSMGMPGMINPINMGFQPSNIPSTQFNPQWNPQTNQSAKLPQHMPDMNAQFANYAAMMAALNPAAFGGNPAAANPFLYQQMLAANPMYAQFLAMMGANPAAMGIDFNWFNQAFRNPQMQGSMQQTAQDGSVSRGIGSYQQTLANMSAQKKPSSVLKNPQKQATQRYSQGMKGPSAGMMRSSTSPGASQKLGTSGKKASSVSGGQSSHGKYQATDSLLKLDFKRQLQAEKRKGLNPCSLHVALARSIARARGLTLSDELRPSFSASLRAESQSLMGQRTKHESDGGVSMTVSKEYVYGSMPASTKGEVLKVPDDADSAGTEETEEEGNIDDLAAAATLASAFSSQAVPADSISSQYVHKNESKDPPRSSPAKRAREEVEDSVSDDQIKRVRSDNVDSNGVLDGTQPNGEVLQESFLPEELIGRRLRICPGGMDDWKEVIVREYNEHDSTHLVEYIDGTSEHANLSTYLLEFVN